MNWYHNFLKISHRNSLDVDGNTIGKLIIGDISSNLKAGNNILGTKTYECKNISQIKTRTLQYATLNVNIYKYNIPLTYNSFSVNAMTLDYSRNRQIIEMHISINNLFATSSLSNLYGIIANILRHEIGHANQNILDYESGKRQEQTRKEQSAVVNKNRSNIIDYVKQVHDEVISEKESNLYIRGIMLESKKKKLPFTQLLRDFIDTAFYGNYKYLHTKSKNYDVLHEMELQTFSELYEKAKLIFGDIK